MAKLPPIPDGSPSTYFSHALQFHSAAEKLYEPDVPLNKPLDFVYSHVLELSFKAFLRTKNVSVLNAGWKTHDLTKLYFECRRLGLVVGKRDYIDIENIVKMLDHANEYEGLRYWNPNLKVVPGQSWTRDVVRQVVAVVEKHVEEYEKLFPRDPSAKKLVFSFDRP